MNGDGAAVDDVEDQVGFQDEHAVTYPSESFHPGFLSEERMSAKVLNQLVQFLDEGRGLRGAVGGDPIVNREQVVDGNRKITDGVITRHPGDALTVLSPRHG